MTRADPSPELDPPPELRRIEPDPVRDALQQAIDAEADRRMEQHRIEADAIAAAVGPVEACTKYRDLYWAGEGLLRQADREGGIPTP